MERVRGSDVSVRGTDVRVRVADSDVRGTDRYKFRAWAHMSGWQTKVTSGCGIPCQQVQLQGELFTPLGLLTARIELLMAIRVTRCG